MKNATRSGLMVPFMALSMWACGGGDAPSQDLDPSGDQTHSPAADAAGSPSAQFPAVRILEPREGEDVEGPDLRVLLDIEGMLIRPAGDPTENSGHHHLYLDEDLTDPTQPVPAVPGRIIHMGDGSSEFVFEAVVPGEHRIIAVVGNHLHFPLQPWVVDTVHFTVR